MIAGSIKIERQDNFKYTVMYRNDDYTDGVIEVDHQTAVLLWTALEQGRMQVQSEVKKALGLLR